MWIVCKWMMDKVKRAVIMVKEVEVVVVGVFNRKFADFNKSYKIHQKKRCKTILKKMRLL